MKYFFLFLFFSLFIALNAKAEFYIESTSTGIVKTDGYDLPNGSKFSILKGTYQWTNSLGYYGTATCKGLLEKENDLSNSVESYQELLKLNNIIEKKFYKNLKSIGKETNQKIKDITKKNEKTS